MCAKLSFDATKVKPQQALDPVPRGWYTVKLVASDIAPAKSDPTGGTRLSLEAEIVEGEYAGRKVFDGINIKNKNPKAQQIGQEQLSSLCHAVAVFKMTDTAELHDKPFELKVGWKDADGDYEAKNEMKGFRPLSGAAPAGAASATAGKPAPAWAAKGKAAPGKPAPAPAPAPEPEPAPVVDESPGGAQADRMFYVYLGDENQEKTGAEIATLLGQGMPEDTPVLAQDEDEGTDWKTAADYEIASWSPPAEPAKPATPPKPAKPAPKAAPAAPVAPAAKGGATPPWLKKK